MTEYEGGRGQLRPTGGAVGAEALKRYLRVLLEHWKLVVACVVIALLAAGAYVETAQKQLPGLGADADLTDPDQQRLPQWAIAAAQLRDSRDRHAQRRKPDHRRFRSPRR